MAPFRRAWPGGSANLAAELAWTKSTIRVHAACCASLYVPVQPCVIRASAATQGISVGCGVRVLSGERTGYAYTDDLAPERILHAARTAAMIASGPAKQPVVGLTDKAAPNLYPVPLPSVEADVIAKVDLLNRADIAARAYDPRIKEVRVSYADDMRRILVIGSDGSFAEDSQPLARMSVFCLAKSDNESSRGTSGGGGRVALDFFLSDKTPEHFAKEAARQAIIQLDAIEARWARWVSSVRMAGDPAA